MEETQTNNLETQAAASSAQPQRGSVISGLSANEMYCTNLIGFAPGNLLVGNSVFSMGILGSIKSSVRTVVGGEIASFTQMISEGRRLSFQRLVSEMQQSQGYGVTSVSSELVFHSGFAEFLSIGSTLHPKVQTDLQPFTTSFDGQELYCQVDAGYAPRSFVFGNVAYSIGIGRGITGMLRTLAKGEVRQYSDIFNETRHLALQRIVDEAKSVGANAVVGIRTSILPFGASGVQEMVMVGTASVHPQAGGLNSQYGVVTSDLTAQETWNLTNMGYMPLQLVLGTSVYSLGVIGGVKSMFRTLVKGEVTEMTQMIYGAREESLRKVQEQATAIGADDVLGIKTYIYDLGNNLIEFLAIGTAVKRMDGLATKSAQLPPQAVIVDKDTFVNSAELAYGMSLDGQNI